MDRRYLADLDELVLACRSETARRHIEEAVACYKAGAYRSCIVATWIALLFDFVDKLRELDLAGDANARQKVAEFEQIQQHRDIEGSLRFEREVLDVAKDEFELLTPMEHEDLVRLQKDRNRCAHPAMNSPEEEYQPPAELSRCHLRNAVQYVLQRPPVQGKAALDRLLAQARSAFFPVSVEEAIRSFSTGPLSRPRDSLVRSFVLVLAKDCLLRDVSPDERRRLSTAISAVRRMFPEISSVALAQRLSGVLRRIEDQDLQRAIWFCYTLRDSWQFLEADCRTKLERFIEDLPDSEVWPCIPFALEVNALSKRAQSRLNHVDARGLARLSANDPLDHRAVYLARAFELWEQSGNFKTTDLLTEVILRQVDLLEEADVERLFGEAEHNPQIHQSGNLQQVIHALAESRNLERETIERIVREHQFGWMLEGPPDW